MKKIKLIKELKEMAIFVLEDDNEVMLAALDKYSDLDKENKQMNRELIKEHKLIISKLEKNKELTKEDLVLIRDANEIHFNDTDNYNGHNKKAIELKNKISYLIREK